MSAAPIEAVVRSRPVVQFPGYRRPTIRVSDYLELLERSTYEGERVR